MIYEGKLLPKGQRKNTHTHVSTSWELGSHNQRPTFQTSFANPGMQMSKRERWTEFWKQLNSLQSATVSVGSTKTHSQASQMWKRLSPAIDGTLTSKNQANSTLAILAWSRAENPELQEWFTQSTFFETASCNHYRRLLHKVESLIVSSTATYRSYSCVRKPSSCIKFHCPELASARPARQTQLVHVCSPKIGCVKELALRCAQLTYMSQHFHHSAYMATQEALQVFNAKVTTHYSRSSYCPAWSGQALGSADEASQTSPRIRERQC